MTPKEREEIFAKEILTIKDLCKLYNLKYDKAAKMMRELRSRNDRLGTVGRILIEDYFIALKISDFSRYCPVPIIKQGEQQVKATNYNFGLSTSY